ncbi:MAG: UDP-3-O-(3-hydroxymyristoyl)glucosamine N-acyltransferase [Leptonema sp. (in: bacteria)]
MKLNFPISSLDLKEKLSKQIDFEIIGKEENFIITEIAPIEFYTKESLVFINSKKGISYLNKEFFPLVIVTNEEIYKTLIEKNINTNFFITKNVDVFRALFLQQYLDRNLRRPYWQKIHPSAVIYKGVQIPDTVIIGPNVVIESDVKIDDNVVIMANCIIEEGAQIGENTILYPNVYLGWGCKIGKNCIIHPGTIIGSEGFGFAQDEKFQHYRIPQLGIVEIEDNVVIGANCCIDRASYEKTVIKQGVITDNFVHIAHNCEIGENSILVAQVGIAGSSKLGKKVICSGQVGISDHVTITDNTILLARTAVLDDILESGTYMGYPSIPATKFQRLQIHLNKLDEYAKKIKELQKKITELEKKIS